MSDLCNPMDHSPPGSSVHGILQARILDWVAMPSSKEIFPTQRSNPHLIHVLHCQAGSLPQVSFGKPIYICKEGLFFLPSSNLIKRLKLNLVNRFWIPESHHKYTGSSELMLLTPGPPVFQVPSKVQ